MNLFPDYGKGIIRYIHTGRYSSGYSFVQFGKAELDTAGKLIVTIMDEDKPTAKQGETVFDAQKDGSIIIKNKWYDKDGKLQGSNWFTVRRL